MQQYREKKDSIGFIRNRLFCIYLLNVTDLIFTRILISTGLFYEANSLMAPVVAGNGGILLKVGLTAGLLTWIYNRIKAARPEQMNHVRLLINICLGLYILINISHFVWLSMLL